MVSIEYLRSFRLAGYALFDFTLAFFGMALAAPLLSWLFKKMGILVPKKNWVILTLPISVLAHVLAGNYTPLTKNFLDPSGHYFVKLIILACCVLGGMNIRRIAPEKRSSLA